MQTFDRRKLVLVDIQYIVISKSYIMLRSEFFEKSLTLGFGLFLAPYAGHAFFTKETTKAPFFKLSLAQWSLHRSIRSNQISPYDFAQKAAQMNFEGLEYVNALYPDVMNAKNKSEALKKFIKKSNEQANIYGLKNLIIMIDDEGDLVVPSAKKRNIAIENHKVWVETAAEMGCHSIRINLFGERNPDLWQERAIASLSALGKFAALHNINIIVENHGYLSSNAALVMKVLEKVNLPNCGTLPDFGNFCLAREKNQRWDGACIAEYDRYQGIKELLPKAFGVSAKSYAFDTQGLETTIDYKRMLSLVKASGYTGYIGVEYEGENKNEIEGILATKALLTSLAETI